MAVIINRSELRNYHVVDIASTYDLDRLFKDIFDTKPLKVSSEEDSAVYLQGFHQSLPLTIAVQGYTLYYRLYDDVVTDDRHQRERLLAMLLEKDYGTDIYLRVGEGYIDFYSRELKIFPEL